MQLKYKSGFILSMVLVMVGICLFLNRNNQIAISDSSGLTPLMLSIDCDSLKPTIANFSVNWSEPHYVGFEMTQPHSKFADSIYQLSFKSVGLKENHLSFDISWKVYEGENLIGFSKPKAELYGIAGSTITLGTFQAKTGKQYRLEIQPHKDFARFKDTKPVVVVEVATASVSVGLALSNGLSNYLANLLYSYFVVSGVILLIIVLVLNYIKRR
jgi:hypothetical protein